MEHGFLSKFNNSNSKISSGYFMDAGRFSSWITKTFSCKFAFLQEGGEPALLFVRFVFCFFFSTLHTKHLIYSSQTASVSNGHR